jgi:hypothetical protein
MTPQRRIESDHPATQDSPKISGSGRSHFSAASIGWAACIPVVAVVALAFPRIIATTDIDQSWGQALGYFYKHHMQAGVDYIFTYGPLGYFASRIYDRDLYFQYFAWEIIIKILYAFATVGLARRYASGLLGVIFLLVATYLSYLNSVEALFRTFILALALPLLLPKPTPRGYMLFACVLLAAISQIKFTFCFFSLGALIAAELPFRRTKPRAVQSPLTIYFAASVLVWLALGQRLFNLPQYIVGSWQISSGYADAVGFTDPDYAPLAIACGLAGLSLWLITLVYLLIEHGLTLRRLSLVLVLLLNVYFTWKHGVVRADLGHLPLMLCYIVILWLMLPLVVEPAKSPNATGAMAHGPRPAFCRWVGVGRILFVCGSVGFCICSSLVYLRATGDPWSCEPLLYTLNTLTHPLDTRAKLDSTRRALARESELPGVKAQVGRGTIDVMSCSQGVLLINDLNYRPRPVFQSYTTFTPYLIAKNASFYRSDRAPEYVLFKLEPITGFPALEDGQALIELVRHYRPILHEHGFVLFRRSREADYQRQTPVISDSRTILDRRVKWGERIDVGALGGKFKTLTVNIAPSLAGSIRSALYKLPNIFMTVHPLAGQDFSERIGVRTAQSPFVLSPTLECFGIIDFYVPSDCSVVSWISFTTDDPGCFDADLRVNVAAIPGLGDTLEPGMVNQLRCAQQWNATGRE